METLRQLAQDGHTVVCSIHQPRGSVYGKFDDIVLLSEGAVVYMGPAQEEPLLYFAKFGLDKPPLSARFQNSFPSIELHFSSCLQMNSM